MKKKLKPGSATILSVGIIILGWLIGVTVTASTGNKIGIGLGVIAMIAGAIIAIAYCVCPYCGQSLRTGSEEYCPHCGKRIMDYFEENGSEEYFDTEEIKVSKEKAPEAKTFRKMTRFKQQISEDECIEVLRNELRGVLSLMGDDGYPYGVPINHYYNPEDGKIYFHGGKKGYKIDAIKRCPKASFCVYDGGYREFGEWALNIRSVIVFGKIEFVEDQETVYKIARELSYKFTSDEKYIQHELDKSGPGTLMFTLVPEYMTGKLVNES